MNDFDLDFHKYCADSIAAKMTANLAVLIPLVASDALPASEEAEGIRHLIQQIQAGLEHLNQATALERRAYQLNIEQWQKRQRWSQVVEDCPF